MDLSTYNIHNAFEIEFGKSINIVNLEELMKDKYTESLKSTEVLFNLYRTKFASTYCLSLILIWINKLSYKKNRKIFFLSPFHRLDGEVEEEAKPILSYFGRWGYWDALEKFGVNVVANQRELMYRKKTERVSDKCIPFKFFDNYNDYNKFLSNFNMNKNLLDLLQESSKVEYFGTSGFRSILLSELGKNAYEHAKGRATHFSLGITPKFSESDKYFVKTKLYRREYQVPRFALPFFKKLGNKRCVEIVISDGGPGITRKLKSHYFNDDILENKIDDPNNKEIIKYAFMLHSSSKKDTFYKDTRAKKYKIPRGLYFVKNVARRNKALVICRSSKTIFCYDFLSSPKGRIGSNAEDPRIKDIVGIGGTQIQILIPILEDTKQIFISKDFLNRNEAPCLEIKPLKLSEVFEAKSSSVSSKEIVRNIHKHTLKCRKSELVVLDFINTRWDKDLLYPVIQELKFLGLDSYKYILINCDKYITDIQAMASAGIEDNIKEKYIHDYSLIRERPFMIIKNDSFQKQVILSETKSTNSEKYQAIFKKVLNGEKVEPNTVPEVLDHLIVQNKKKIASLTFSAQHLFKSIKKYDSENLKEIITKEKFHIRHRGKFLFPTLAYSENFYQIRTIFENNNYRNRLKLVVQNELESIIKDTKYVLSISEVGNIIGQIICETFQGYKLQHLNILKPNTKRSYFLKLPKEKFVICVDVIATGKSLDQLFDRMPDNLKTCIVGLFTILDIREKKYPKDKYIDGKFEYDFKYCAYKPTKLYLEEKPMKWNWVDIKRIDPISWSIIDKGEARHQLWKTGDFIENCIFQANGIEKGHFYLNEERNHYSYFFITKNICTTFNYDIAKYIIDDARELIDTDINLTKITQIVASSESIGLTNITEGISSELNADLYSINPVTQHTKLLEGEIVDCVLIIDSALSSGETAWNLLEITNTWNPKAILIYTIINRSVSKISERLNKLQRYNGSKIFFRQVVTAQLPAYTYLTCPICKRIKSFQKILDNRDYGWLHDIAKKQIDILKPKNIKMFLSEGYVTKIDDKTILMSMVKIRIRIQKAMENNPDEWDYLMNIIISPTESSIEGNILVSVLFSELDYFYNQRQLFPPDFRTNLFDYLLKNISKKKLTRESIGLMVAFSPEHSFSNIDKILKNIGLESISIVYLVLEILLLNSEKKIEKLRTIYNKIYAYVKAHQYEIEGKIPEYIIISVLDQIMQNLGVQRAKINEESHKILQYFKKLHVAVFKRDGAKHDRLKEKWPFIVNLTYDTIEENVKNFYSGRSGIYKIITSEILPYFESIDNLTHITIKKEHPYFRYQFKRDIDILNSTILKILSLKKERKINRQNFDNLWDYGEIKEARKRIAERIIQKESALKKFLKSQFTDPRKSAIKILDSYENIFKEQEILLEIKIKKINNLIFIREDYYFSILNDFFSNIIKHGYKDILDEKKVIFELYKNNDIIVISIQDNGIGINSNDKKKIEDNMAKYFKAYDANLKIKSKMRKTKIEMAFHTIEEVLC